MTKGNVTGRSNLRFFFRLSIFRWECNEGVVVKSVGYPRWPEHPFNYD